MRCRQIFQSHHRLFKTIEVIFNKTNNMRNNLFNQYKHKMHKILFLKHRFLNNTQISDDLNTILD